MLLQHIIVLSLRLCPNNDTLQVDCMFHAPVPLFIYLTTALHPHASPQEKVKAMKAHFYDHPHEMTRNKPFPEELQVSQC